MATARDHFPQRTILAPETRLRAAITSGNIALIIANGFILTVYQNLPDELNFYALFAA